MLAKQERLPRINRFGCLEPSLMLWLVIVSAAIHTVWLMPVIRQMVGGWSELLADPRYLFGDCLVVMILYTWFNRIPDAGGAFRWIWRYGRWLLLVAYVWTIGCLFWINMAILMRTDHRHFEALVILGSINMAAILYLLSAKSVRDVFADFPLPLDSSVVKTEAQKKVQARQLLAQHARLSTPIASTPQQEQIEAYWRAEAENSSSLALPWVELGVLAYQCGKTLQALDFMEEAYSREPENPIVLRNFCELLRQKGHASRAITYGERAVTLAPHDEIARLNLAQALVDDQKTDLAITEFHRVLDINPGHLPSWLNLAILLLHQGRKTDACAALDAVLLLEPGHEQALHLKKQLSP